MSRGSELIERSLEKASGETADLRNHLRALSPQRTLDRGYAIAQSADGQVIRSADDAPAGTPVLPHPRLGQYRRALRRSIG